MRRVVALLAALTVVVFAAAAGAAPANEDGWPRQWNMRLIGAEAAWDKGLLGEGVEIAIVDTGVHLTHQDLVAGLVPGKNFVEPDQPPQDRSADDYGPIGHGTHVAGIAAARLGNGGVVGVAPQARIVPVKVLDDNGSGSGDDVAAGIQWAADNGAEVINLSLGEYDQSLFGPSTQNAVSYAWSKGSICVFAAGNDFVLPSGFRDQPAIVVASVSPDDRKSYYSSNVGAAKWALAAPGGPAALFGPEDESVFSATWERDDRANTYRYLQGTSQAAPHVAGAAALLRAAGLSPQATVDRLLATAKDLGAAGRDSTYGSGRLDVAKAVEGLGEPSPATTTAAPPTTTAGSPPTTVRARPPATTVAPRPPGAADTTTVAPPAEEGATTTTAPTGSEPSVAGDNDDDETAGTVVIRRGDGGTGRRPWVLIGLAAAAVAMAAGAIVAGRALFVRAGPSGGTR